MSFSFVQMVPPNSHTLGGGGSLEKEELSQTEQLVQCIPHHYPVISRESPCGCSSMVYFCSLMSVQPWESPMQGRGRPKFYHQRAARSCARPDQPLRSSAPLRERLDQPGPGEEQGWAEEALLLKQARKEKVPRSQGTKKNMRVSPLPTMTNPIAYTVLTID